MKILLPVDGSALSLEAVQFAVRMMADGMRASVVLANVQEPASLYELVVAHDPELIDRACAEAGVHALQPAQVLLDAAAVDYECEVAKGDPAHTIIEIAERFGCDLIVMGAKGRSLVSDVLVGSVAQRVLALTKLPVTFVK